MKISKTSLMILAVGVFIIILVGTGMTRFGQIKEQERLDEELALVETRLSSFQLPQYQVQINELQEQLKGAQERTVEAQQRLKQTVISVDVLDKFYEIAAYYDVTVVNVSISSIFDQPYEGIDCETVSLSAGVSGDMDELVDFVIGLNDNFATGFIRSISLAGTGDSIGIQMVIYSYKGS